MLEFYEPVAPVDEFSSTNRITMYHSRSAQHHKRECLDQLHSGGGGTHDKGTGLIASLVIAVPSAFNPHRPQSGCQGSGRVKLNAEIRASGRSTVTCALAGLKLQTCRWCDDAKQSSHDVTMTVRGSLPSVATAGSRGGLVGPPCRYLSWRMLSMGMHTGGPSSRRHPTQRLTDAIITSPPGAP